MIITRMRAPCFIINSKKPDSSPRSVYFYGIHIFGVVFRPGDMLGAEDRRFVTPPPPRRLFHQRRLRRFKLTRKVVWLHMRLVVRNKPELVPRTGASATMCHNRPSPAYPPAVCRKRR